MAELRVLLELAESLRLARGEDVGREGEAALFILESGSVSVSCRGQVVETLGPGGYCGEEGILFASFCILDEVAAEDSVVYRIPAAAVIESPLLLWRLRETFERRLAEAKRFFTFDWRDEYSVGVGELDAHRSGIFEAIDELARLLAAREAAPETEAGNHARLAEALAPIRSRAAARYEEASMAAWGYPALAEHAPIHAQLLAEIDGFADRIEKGEPEELIDFMKDCLLRHTLIFDREYMAYSKKKR